MGNENERTSKPGPAEQSWNQADPNRKNPSQSGENVTTAGRLRRSLVRTAAAPIVRTVTVRDVSAL